MNIFFQALFWQREPFPKSLVVLCLLEEGILGSFFVFHRVGKEVAQLWCHLPQ